MRYNLLKTKQKNTLIILFFITVTYSCMTYKSDDIEIIIDSEGTHITTPEYKYETPEGTPEPDSKALDEAIESIKEQEN